MHDTEPDLYLRIKIPALLSSLYKSFTGQVTIYATLALSTNKTSGWPNRSVTASHSPPFHVENMHSGGHPIT
jgi:hypothetical protein